MKKLAVAKVADVAGVVGFENLREHAPKILQNPTNESPWGSSDFLEILHT